MKQFMLNWFAEIKPYFMLISRGKVDLIDMRNEPGRSLIYGFRTTKITSPNRYLVVHLLECFGKGKLSPVVLKMS